MQSLPTQLYFPRQQGGWGGKERKKNNTLTKILKTKLSKERRKKKLEGIIIFPAISLTFFEQRQRRRMACCAEPAQAYKPWERSYCHITLLCDTSAWSEPAAAAGGEVKEFKAEVFQNPPVLWRSQYLKPGFEVCSNPGFSSCPWEGWILRNRQELIIWEGEVF